MLFLVSQTQNDVKKAFDSETHIQTTQQKRKCNRPLSRQMGPLGQCLATKIELQRLSVVPVFQIIIKKHHFQGAHHTQGPGRGDAGRVRGRQDWRRPNRVHRVPLGGEVDAAEQPGRGVLGGGSVRVYGE
jgi:hypothetical protein